MRLGETPVPIPNTMVKTRAAENTLLETAREDRWLPDIQRKINGSRSTEVDELTRKGGNYLRQDRWLGWSRNKVAVPEGAAGSPPFKEPKGNPVKAVVKTTVDREVENRKFVQTYQKMYTDSHKSFSKFNYWWGLTLVIAHWQLHSSQLKNSGFNWSSKKRVKYL